LGEFTVTEFGKLGHTFIEKYKMSDLNFKEKRILERILEMGSGYVLDFSNRTMQEFFIDSMGVDIYIEKYSFKGESKANRLRAFWEIESNYNVGLLIEKLLDHWLMQFQTGLKDYDYSDEKLYKECIIIVERLKSGGPVESLDSIKPNTNDVSFEKLTTSIKHCINNNEPETGIDRLHTFVMKYIRELCVKHNIIFEKESPLHSLFGMYVKHLTASNIIESEMTIRILKSSISVLEAFNKVRNEQSFAHDNSILNYHESLLIFNDIANVIRFIEAIEKRNEPVEKNSENGDNDLPF
jgi:hypothetical protein